MVKSIFLPWKCQPSNSQRGSGTEAVARRAPRAEMDSTSQLAEGKCF